VREHRGENVHEGARILENEKDLKNEIAFEGESDLEDRNELEGASNLEGQSEGERDINLEGESDFEGETHLEGGSSTHIVYYYDVDQCELSDNNSDQECETKIYAHEKRGGNERLKLDSELIKSVRITRKLTWFWHVPYL